MPVDAGDGTGSGEDCVGEFSFPQTLEVFRGPQERMHMTPCLDDSDFRDILAAFAMGDRSPVENA